MPLYIAAMNGNTDTLMPLLDAGAQVNAVTKVSPAAAAAPGGARTSRTTTDREEEEDDDR